jgi:hypothetical protein
MTMVMVASCSDDVLLFVFNDKRPLHVDPHWPGMQVWPVCANHGQGATARIPAGNHRSFPATIKRRRGRRSRFAGRVAVHRRVVKSSLSKLQIGRVNTKTGGYQ